MKLELTRVILFAKDVAALSAFYRDILGLPLLPGASDEWVELDAGACRIAIHAGGDAPATRRGPKLVFGVRDVAAVRETLIARGAPMGKVVVFGEISLCDGKDPEGHAFQLSNRP
jgi:hypothetical protein